MKLNFLLPHRFKTIGWIIFSVGIVLGLCFLAKGGNFSFFETKVFALFYGGIFEKPEFLGWTTTDILDEIAACFIILGALLLMFSKQKQEDEFIASLRLNALSWAVFANYAVLLLSVLLVYDIPFFWVLVFNMFTILFIFVLRLYWLLHKVSKKE